MKKFLVIVFVITLVFSFTFSASAAPANTNSASISVKEVNKNTVTFNVTVNGGSGYIGWLDFGDPGHKGLGASLTNQAKEVTYTYSAIGTYHPNIWMDKLNACSTTVIVKEITQVNCVGLKNLNLNKLEVYVATYNTWQKLDWGDNTSVDVPAGVGMVYSHDYAYAEKGTTTRNISIDNIIVAKIEINGQTKKSALTVIENGNDGKIVVLNNDTTPIPTSLPVNDWKTNNIVILDLKTEIRTGAGNNYTITTIVSDSYWLAKVIENPVSIDKYTWCKIQLADNTTGYVRIDQATPTKSLFS